jgi:hypothetical protein
MVASAQTALSMAVVLHNRAGADSWAFSDDILGLTNLDDPWYQNDLPSIGWSIDGLSAADLDGDGKDDLIVAIHGGGFQDPAGRPVATVMAPSMTYYVESLAGPAFDCNGDDKLDVMGMETIDRSGTVVSGVMCGNGDGTLQPPAPIQCGPLPIGDFNGDGKTDAAVVTSAGAIVIYMNGR